MKNIFLVGFFALSVNAFAANMTVLETPVTYHPDASVVDNVKKECKLEEQFEKRIGAILAKANRAGNGTVEKGNVLKEASLLRLQITHVLGVGGGAWSGPKAITVSADLIENDKVVRHTKINRWSVGGMFGGFKGTCSILNRDVEAIGKDLSKWISDPSYQIVNEPAPKEADLKKDGEASKEEQAKE
jgi:hypothetical protein